MGAARRARSSINETVNRMVGESWQFGEVTDLGFLNLRATAEVTEARGDERHSSLHYQISDPAAELSGSVVFLQA